MKPHVNLLNYQAPNWDEPLLMDLSTPGERGIFVPRTEDAIKDTVGVAAKLVPEGMLRKTAPDLPELSQPQVLRHFLRLSQMTQGTDVANDIGGGTCTMKYSPKLNEQICASPKIAEIHPDQDEDTMQGILEILYKMGEVIKEITGMDEVSFQPGSGSQAILTNTAIVRACQIKNGTYDEKDEIVTTMFSHPSDAACPSTLGYQVNLIMPDENGYPDMDTFKAAVGRSTAALLICNPEDTGVYNPRIREFTCLVHEAGGLCIYDQANANGIMGKARAREAGFDLVHLNLHKTFSSPHGGMGPSCGVIAVTKELAGFLPVPVVRFDGSRYYLDYNLSASIGKIRSFYGNVEVVLRSYAWTMALGAEGLVEVAETSVINNNYLRKRLLDIKGVSMPYFHGEVRLDQIRFSLEQLEKDTGVTTEDVNHRIVDYGLQSYWESHHPHIVAQPFTPEPCESYSLKEIDYWAAVMEKVCTEAYETPEIVKTAPHNGIITKIDESVMFDDSLLAATYKQYKKKWKQNQ
ncbi:MAG: aminomethyl-transferring glycine dehydrogenase subunit GcvPB [Proteobacteria bacterium]|nr:aminomethyl-transferring glycine dehydrogenase subunit GcvPB [Pseudomonadota bacterium]